MLTPLLLFFLDPPVFNVPTRLCILHQEDMHLVYDPVSGYPLEKAILKHLAEEYAEGFLDAMKAYGTLGCLSLDRWADDTDEYAAYALGVAMAVRICEYHVSRGGIFAIEE